MTTREPITSSTRTTIGAAVAALCVLVPYAVWLNNIGRDVAYIRATLADTWRTGDMRLWAERLGRSNPSLELPDVDAIQQPPRP